MSNFLNAYKFALAWAFFALVVCGVNGAYLPHFTMADLMSFDKIAHMGLFGSQTWFIAKARFKLYPAKNLNTQIILPAFLLSVAYGALIEGLQATVFINRSYDFADMIANTIGCVLAWFVLRRFLK